MKSWRKDRQKGYANAVKHYYKREEQKQTLKYKLRRFFKTFKRIITFQ